MPGCVWDGDGGGLGLTEVGRTGGVDDMMRSAATDKRPRMAPPNAAAVGITRFSS
jgi:hypothetical protein